MNITLRVAAYVFAIGSLSASAAFGQSNITETGRAQIVVDSTSGADTATGTLSSPVKTLSAAVAKAAALNARGVSAKISVNPGVYRESLDLSGLNGQSNAPITIEAAGSSPSIISGSDVVTGWAHSSGSVYVHSWSYGSTTCPVPSGWPSRTIGRISLQRNMVFVNGYFLTQVLSHSQLKTGTFYIDTGRKLIYVWPQNGANMGSAKVEITVRPAIMSISGRSNVTIRNLTFQHASSCMNSNAVTVFGTHNVLLDHLVFRWNNWGGLFVGNSSNVTVQNSKAAHNGGIGFVGTRNKDILFQNVESDYNNWRGAMSNFFDWGMGGLKLLLTHGGTVRNYVAYHNHAQGLWFDTDNKNITVDNVKLIGNAWASLQLEANQGPITVKNSLVCDGGSGINFLTSEHVTITGTTMFNNGGAKLQAQIYLAGRPGGRSIRDWETGQSYHLYTQNATFTNNVVEDKDSSQFVFGTYLSAGDFSHFSSSLHSNNNIWFDAQRSTVFTLAQSHHVSFSGWKGSTGQDSGSKWQAYASAQQKCAAVHPTM